MEAFVTTGLVLKETRYKESDRILTILTPELGVISAAAQSSLRIPLPRQPAPLSGGRRRGGRVHGARGQAHRQPRAAHP